MSDTADTAMFHTDDEMGLADQSPTQSAAEDLISFTGLSATDFGDKLSGVVWQSLHAEFPWLNTDAITELAERCGGLVKNTLVEKQPLIQAAKSRTSFMSLSPELREMVYEFALISEESDLEFAHPKYQPPFPRCPIHNFYSKPVIYVQKCYTSLYGRPDYYGWTSELSAQPALTRVSRQVRDEALPIHYGKNEFVAFMNYKDPEQHSLDTIQSFLSCIGKLNAGFIRRLTLLFPNEKDHGFKNMCGLSSSQVRVELNDSSEYFGIAPTAVQMLGGGDCRNCPHTFFEFGWAEEEEEETD